jgi:hypothetical protein
MIERFKLHLNPTHGTQSRDVHHHLFLFPAEVLVLMRWVLTLLVMDIRRFLTIFLNRSWNRPCFEQEMVSLILHFMRILLAKSTLNHGMRIGHLGHSRHSALVKLALQFDMWKDQSKLYCEARSKGF